MFLQAQAESVVRTALDELNMWSFERIFDLTEFRLNSSEESSVIAKGWTKLLDEVEDHINLTSSLTQSSHHHLMKVFINQKSKKSVSLLGGD